MILYWDASAIVKLIIREPGSDAARAWFDESNPFVTCRIAYAEVMAALGMAMRVGRLASEDLPTAESALRHIWADTFVLEVAQVVVERAGQLAIRHGLRGYDSVHLAAAVSHGDPARVPERPAVVTWDARLADAALAEGLCIFGDRMQSPPSPLEDDG